MFRLRRYVKHSRQCFIGYPNISNFVKNTSLCFVFSTLFRWLEIGWNTVRLSCLIYYSHNFSAISWTKNLVFQLTFTILSDRNLAISKYLFQISFLEEWLSGGEEVYCFSPGGFVSRVKWNSIPFAAKEPLFKIAVFRSLTYQSLFNMLAYVLYANILRFSYRQKNVLLGQLFIFLHNNCGKKKKPIVKLINLNKT